MFGILRKVRFGVLEQGLEQHKMMSHKASRAVHALIQILMTDSHSLNVAHFLNFGLTEKVTTLPPATPATPATRATPATPATPAAPAAPAAPPRSSHTGSR